MNTTITTKYLRLLSHENACKVIDFINDLDSDNYANITIGGVCMLFMGGIIMFMNVSQCGDIIIIAFISQLDLVRALKRIRLMNL